MMLFQTNFKCDLLLVFLLWRSPDLLNATRAT